MTTELPPPILITGCARSGTSMVAGAIHLCGAFGGVMSGPNLHNKKGMFENIRIRNSITKPFLSSIGADPLGQYPLPNLDNLPIPTDWRRMVESVIIEEGYKKGPWFYKGAKMCLFWPVWHFAFPDAKWVIVRRRTGDIAASCVKAGFMKAFANADVRRAVGVSTEFEGWVWWVNRHLDRFVEMINAGLNCKVIWPHKMVRGDYTELFELIDWLRLKWNSDVLSFIDPKLYKSRCLDDRWETWEGLVRK